MQKGIIAIIIGVLIIGGVWFVNLQRGADPEEGVIIGDDAVDGSIQNDAISEEGGGLFGDTDKDEIVSEVKEFTVWRFGLGLLKWYTVSYDPPHTN
ncbi:MAG: hypothetical protein WDZ74_02345 [Candidatus Paceibacterota bacterium]